jgi:hypothetical protein
MQLHVPSAGRASTAVRARVSARHARQARSRRAWGKGAARGEGASGGYQDGEGSTGCKACSACSSGSRQSCGGASEGYCVDCTPGRYTDTSGDCDDCPSGYFQSASNQPSCTQCADCPAGSRNSCSNSFEGYCVDCVPGKFVREGACVTCPASYYQPDTNGASCMACGSCPAGSRRGCGNSTEGLCSECAPGKFVSAGACESCPAGYFQAEANQPSCLQCADCPAGSRQNCGRSSEGYCGDCTPGKFVSVALEECVGCPGGYYQSGTNQAECEGCEQGKYQDGTSPAFCVACPPGSFSSYANETSCGECGAAGRVQRCGAE